MPDRTLLDAMAVQLIAAMRDPMKSSGSASGGGSRVAGQNPQSTTSNPKPARHAAVPEREVTVRRAIEGVTTGKPDVRAMWRVEEGPHGELVYERKEAV